MPKKPTVEFVGTLPVVCRGCFDCMKQGRRALVPLPGSNQCVPPDYKPERVNPDISRGAYERNKKAAEGRDGLCGEPGYGGNYDPREM